MEGRLSVMIIAIIVLLFLPLTFSAKNNNINNNNASAQTPHYDWFASPKNTPTVSNDNSGYNTISSNITTTTPLPQQQQEGQSNLTNSNANNGFPTWSPDGTKIASVSLGEALNFDIYVMNAADGSNETRLIK
jgi:hypothetical protein